MNEEEQIFQTAAGVASPGLPPLAGSVEQAMGKTVNAAPAGGGLERLFGGARHTAAAPVSAPTASGAERDVVGSLMRTAMAVVRQKSGRLGNSGVLDAGARGPGGLGGLAALDAAMGGGYDRSALAKPQGAPTVPAGRDAPSGMTMLRPVGGGAATPHYEYGGMMVALPRGVDANDASAVSAATEEQNELIDAMNGLTDEEED